MPKFMVVVKVQYDDEDKPEFYSEFFDSIDDAERCRQNVECGFGGYAEVYERNSDPYGEYEFLYS